MASSLLVCHAQGSVAFTACCAGSLDAGPSNRLSSFEEWGGALKTFRKFCHRQCALKNSRNGSVAARAVLRAEESSLSEVEESSPKFDVSSNCVTPTFRSAPWQGTDKERETDSSKANILFLSEGNVCRSVYAEAMFNRLLVERGLDELVACSSKATRDYNVGEPPDPRAVQIAQELGFQLREGATARMIDHAKDIVQYDLILCFDKFNAADVLKEISVYDTINAKGKYSVRVRRLTEFARGRAIEELDDPLYGNMGGPDEFDNLRQSARDIWDCCEGLADKLQEINQELPEGRTLQEAIALSLAGMDALDWLVPPMLQKREKATL